MREMHRERGLADAGHSVDDTDTRRAVRNTDRREFPQLTEFLFPAGKRANVMRQCPRRRYGEGNAVVAIAAGRRGHESDLGGSRETKGRGQFTSRGRRTRSAMLQLADGPITDPGSRREFGLLQPRSHSQLAERLAKRHGT
jgi:hypothetical protein